MKQPKKRTLGDYYRMLPKNGFKESEIWSYTAFEGQVYPYADFDHKELCLLLPDGTKRWVEKTKTESVFVLGSPGVLKGWVVRLLEPEK